MAEEESVSQSVRSANAAARAHGAGTLAGKDASPCLARALVDPVQQRRPQRVGAAEEVERHGTLSVQKSSQRATPLQLLCR